MKEFILFTQKSVLLKEFEDFCEEHLATQHGRDVYTYDEAVNECLCYHDLTSQEVLDICEDTRFALIEDKGRDKCDALISYIRDYYENELYTNMVFDLDFKKVYISKILQFSKIKAREGLLDYFNDLSDFDEDDLREYCEGGSND